MILEVTRLFDRWLKHGEYGVAAMLATVPRGTPEGGVDALPAVPDIYNDLESDGSIDPATVPALMVFVDSDQNVDAKDQIRQITYRLVVTVAYVTRDTAPVQASLDGGYVLRAVRKSLTRYNDQRNSFAFRELNGIKVAACENVTIKRVAGAVGRSQLWGFVVASLIVIETEP